MKLKDWRHAAGLSKAQFARNLGKILNRDITANHVSAWERGSMPGWDAGEGISMLTGEKVRATDFARAQAASGSEAVGR